MTQLIRIVYHLNNYILIQKNRMRYLQMNKTLKKKIQLRFVILLDQNKKVTLLRIKMIRKIWFNHNKNNLFHCKEMVSKLHNINNK